MCVTKRQKSGGLLGRIMEHRAYYIMLLPGLIYFAIFKFAPMYGVIISFKDFRMNSGITNSPFASPWYKHFLDFFSSPFWGELLANTIAISMSKLLLGTLFALLLALILNECRSSLLRRTVQTITYMPHFFSWVVVYGIVYIFVSENSGIVNRFLNELTGSTIPFLTSPRYFRSVLYVSHIWKGMGYSSIVYLSAMASIDMNLYEAALVDGAGRFRRIFHITLPGIRSTIIMLLILNIGNILNAGFDQIFVMYNSQVYSVADIIDTWVYRAGLQEMRFSLAAAVGLFKSVIGFIMVFGTNKLAKIWEEGIW
ncbi:ABC transporter permease subunit [Ruminococcaceae bacterium OttesenSCG-928-L11]|nr:ABC transporter permease subunit [Ruminococcaceae bacterium OttesenSCG-928-L11]